MQPQNSMPDVIIWMISGEKRIAYFRCAAHHVLWSQNPDYRGKYCAQLSTIELKVSQTRDQSVSCCHTQSERLLFKRSAMLWFVYKVM